VGGWVYLVGGGGGGGGGGGCGGGGFAAVGGAAGGHCFGWLVGLLVLALDVVVVVQYKSTN